MTVGEVAERKGRKLAIAGFLCALFMTAWAVFLDIATFATNDYFWILIQAVSFADGAMLLLVLTWKRMSRAVRAIALNLILIDLLVMWDAGVERLLGW